MAERREAFIQARKAAGYTQEGLAELMRCDRTTVAHWESGKCEPLPYRWPKLAKLLGVSRAELSKLLGAAASARGRRAAVTSATIGTSTKAANPAPVRSLPALDTDEQHHLAVALADARRYLDSDVVDYFRRQLDRCEADDGTLGPTKALPVVLGVLNAIDQHARAVKPTVRCALLSLGARSAEFAGWLYRDIRDPAHAAFWYSRATEWAQEAGDMAAQGYILLRKSQMAYDERDAVRVLTLAQAAQYGPWELPAHVRAEVTQQEAHGLAMVGEPLQLVEQKLTDAERFAGNSMPSDAGELGHYTEATLWLRSASCYVEAGKPRQAATLFQNALDSGTLSRRDQGYYLARRATALALAGEPDEAAASGLEAVSLAAATNSQRTKRELARTLERLELWISRPGPRELREAMAAQQKAVTNPS